MAIFKCKICGGSLEIDSAQSVATCEYCGTKQTLPKLDNERRANLYDRANHFRRNNDFDKAMGIYENILNEDNTDAEAYWSIVLCRYGIEYVEDPATHKRIPTVNRAQFTSIFDDEDYKSAVANADGYQREIYEAEANAINEIQKGILAISQKEEPFDVFVCYKETDNNGRRTQDSVLATELYHELTREGFKVFFSRITLEDKLGIAYEPYIFAALNSAKVMVVLGTKAEHFNAVWVKNEWSRYLALIKNGAKKTLIPAYRDMNPYDLPEEFSHLQAQDMSKLGFMQDLTRGIKKIVEADAPKTTIKETVVASATVANIAPLLKRAFMFLEDGDFDRADDFCEQVLNQDPENAQAYLGKLMAELQVKHQADLVNCAEPFDINKNYQKAVRFADNALATELKGYVSAIKDRNARKAEKVRKESLYLKAMDDYKSYDVTRLQNAIKVFTSLAGYKDSDDRIRLCQAKIDQIHIKEENDNSEKQRQAEIDRIEAEKRAKRNKKIAMIVSPIVVAVIAFVIVLNSVIIPNGKYNDAVALMNDEKYEEAISAFEALNGYKDSETKINACKQGFIDYQYQIAYNDAVALMNDGKYEEAISSFEALNGYKDSEAKINACKQGFIDYQYQIAYNEAIAFMNDGKYEDAISIFESLDGYRDSAAKIDVCNSAILDNKYNDAIALMNDGKYEDAISIFKALDGYKNSTDKITECNTALLGDKYSNAISSMNSGNIIDAFEELIALNGYKDSTEKATSIYNSYKTQKLESAKVGDSVFLGLYEQDNKPNGKEYIEWIVLDKKNGKLLLISKSILDCKRYNSNDVDVTWETCTLRQWLNNEFINTAFSTKELSTISTTTVSTDTPDWNTSPGNPTNDKIFILSLTEANTYFSSDNARRCNPTAYATAQGTNVDYQDGGCYWWWIRTPGIYQSQVQCVKDDGYAGGFGISAYEYQIGVRPAMWIDVSKLS